MLLFYVNWHSTVLISHIILVFAAASATAAVRLINIRIVCRHRFIRGPQRSPCKIFPLQFWNFLEFFFFFFSNRFHDLPLLCSPVLGEHFICIFGHVNASCCIITNISCLLYGGQEYYEETHVIRLTCGVALDVFSFSTIYSCDVL